MKTTNDSSTRRNLYLPDSQWAELSELATRRGVSVAELVRRAIRAYLKRVRQH